MTRTLAPTHPSLLDRYLTQAEAAIRAREGIEERDANLEAILEVLAMTVALEVMGELVRVPPATRESLRRVGARALLQIGSLLPSSVPIGGETLSDEDEDRAEAVRLIGPYARDGIRALAGKEPPAARRDDAIVLDGELVGLSQGRFDGFRLAEIAWRVRESSAARRALGMLRRVEASTDATRLRLAADGAAPMRDPSSGRRIAELTIAGHAIELHRFEDATIAAYAASAVLLRLGGEHVTSRVSLPGYAEASFDTTATRLDLEVAGVTTTFEISPS